MVIVVADYPWNLVGVDLVLSWLAEVLNVFSIIIKMSSQDFCDSEDFQDLKPSKARYSKTTMKVLRL